MGNFVRRCECGTLVRLALGKPTRCPNCNASVGLKGHGSKDDQDEKGEELVTIGPVVD